MLRPCFQHLRYIIRKRIEMPDGVSMRLNRLERPEPWARDLLAMMRDTFPIEEMQQYPDYPPFYRRLARFTGVKPENIVVGAGIEEFIRTLMLISAGPGEKVAVLWPTCAMFEIYARVFGIALCPIITDPAKPKPVQEIIEGLPDDLRLLILANPGQPVETCYSLDDLRHIAEACRSRDCVFAVDEAYYGFGAPSAVPLIKSFDNLVVLRTFSKAFGAAGIRLGYAIGGIGLIGALNAVRQSGEVSSFSMHAATVLMEHYQSHVAPGIGEIVAGRDWLRERVLSEMGFPAYGWAANHVLIDFGRAFMKSAVVSALAKQGILVKGDFPDPIDRHILVTCGSPALMARFYESLRVIL